jgi:hypothetical protein
MFKNISKFTLIIIFFLIANCGISEKDPVTGENRNIEPNAGERAKKAAQEGGGIFSNITNPRSSTTFEFTTSNVLWRATLKTLDFLPLTNADYSGGVIIYDWYSQNNNQDELIKISVQFLNNEIRSDSIKITAHKKICNNSGKCTNATVDQKFADTIKENIITSARSLKIEETKKIKK